MLYVQTECMIQRAFCTCKLNEESNVVSYVTLALGDLSVDFYSTLLELKEVLK